MHRRAGVRAVEAGLELVEQADAIVEMIGGHQRTQVLHTPRRVGHDQRLMPSAKKARAIAAIADRDVIGQRAVRIAQFLGRDGPQAGISQAAHAFLVTRVEIVFCSAMCPFSRAHAAHQGSLVHQLRQRGKCSLIWMPGTLV